MPLYSCETICIKREITMKLHMAIEIHAKCDLSATMFHARTVLNVRTTATQAHYNTHEISFKINDLNIAN